MLRGSPDVIVVGAGAAGIIAGWRSSQLGARTLVLEKTPRIGTKILVSGGGKCNITHAGTIEEVLKAFRPNEAKFLRPSFYRFTNTEIVDMVTEMGLEVYTREDKRIFPVHQTAKDVVAMLSTLLDRCEVRKETPVTGLLLKDGVVKGVSTEFGELECEQVVVCVGGSSFPNSGTTGDGWPWTKDAGHQIVPIRAALAPMYLQLQWETPSGIAIRDGVLKARSNGKEIARWRGDTLFTHQGVSGPCALGISRIVAATMLDDPVSLEFDLFPDLPFEALRDDFISKTQSNPLRTIATHLETHFPERIVALILGDAKIQPSERGKDFTKQARNRLIEVLKGWNLGQVRAVPLEKGECVAGGVSLDEVDPKTMESLVCKGLYLCGEILDIAGPVGGYNLQAAWSTGFVAGETAANAAKSVSRS